MTALLDVKGLRASYGQVPVLYGLDFHVDEGEVVVLLGANGAGKTTTLRAVSQMSMVTTHGDILFEGKQLRGLTGPRIVRLGVAHVPQGRGTFPELSVRDNLLVGAFVRKDKEIHADIDSWFATFPRLRDRQDQLAGSLSGGEQQMLAVARALMSRPKLLLLDEPSLGLAPLVIQGLFKQFAELNARDGTTMLVVEQNANLALDVAHRAYVLEAGEIALSGTADELKHDDAVRRAYLGF
jgi:branched-chain amino acid transport system ATP-binding protein